MPRLVKRAEPPPRIPLKVLERVVHPAGLVTLRLEALPVEWRPGDCVAVYGPESGHSRPYSLSGGTGDPYTELLIRRIDGGEISPWLCGLRPGRICEVSPPFGWFRPGGPGDAPKIQFATGSGIAPFLSGLRSGCAPAEKVLWGVRDAGDVVFVDEIPNLEVWVSRGDPGPWNRGRLTGGLDGIAPPPDAHLYMCGLDAMMDDVAAWAKAGGVGERRLHRECFFTRSSQAS